jgi:hypothetical protein
MFGNSVNQIGAAIADKDRSIRRAYAIRLGLSSHALGLGREDVQGVGAWDTRWAREAWDAAEADRATGHEEATR